jgi:hypothetical protein
MGTARRFAMGMIRKKPAPDLIRVEAGFSGRDHARTKD